MYGFRYGYHARRRSVRGWGPVEPLFANGEPGLWIDSSDLSTLFQDTAGTTPVTAPGQQVALALDKSGRGGRLIQPTALARLTLGRHPVGGRRNLLTNTECPNGTGDLTSGGQVTAVADIEGGRTGLRLNNTTANAWAYKTNPLAAGSSCSLSVTVEMEDGAPPVFGGGAVSGLNTFALVAGGPTLVPTVIERVGTKVWRCGWSGTSGGTGGVGIFQATTNQQRRIKVTGFSLVPGTDPGAYQRVTSEWDVTEAGKRDCWYLAFDGVDDFMVTEVALDLSSTSKLAIFAGLRADLPTGTACWIELSELSNFTPGCFYSSAPLVSSGVQCGSALSVRGATGAGSVLNIAGFMSSPSVVTHQIDTSAYMRSRINGVQTQTAFTQGGNFAAGRKLYLGARAGTSYFFKGRLYQLVIRGAETPDAQVLAVEADLKAKMGIAA